MNCITRFIALALIVAISACAQPKKATPTGLALQSIQTKEFETSKSVAFAATVSVFQDLGYIVEAADKESGFITAKSASKNVAGFFDALAYQTATGYTKGTAFIEEVKPGLTRVRLNFVVSKSSSSMYGQQASQDTPITDSAQYQVAFEKIEEGIFIRDGVK